LSWRYALQICAKRNQKRLLHSTALRVPVIAMDGVNAENTGALFLPMR